MSQDALLFVQYDKRAAHRNPGIVYLIGRLGVEPSSRSYACDWLAPAHTTVMLTPVERHNPYHEYGALMNWVACRGSNTGLTRQHWARLECIQAVRRAAC